GSILEALAKFACLGGDYKKARLSFQEYFERPLTKNAWGKPAAALLAALQAQVNLGIPAIGGKDSMSGNYRNGDLKLSVPPTFVAFAAGTAPVTKIRSGALSGKPGNAIILLCRNTAGKDTDEWKSFRANMEILEDLTAKNLVRSAYPVGSGGIAAALAVMAFGNMTGIEVYESVLNLTDGLNYQGSVLAEIEDEAKLPEKYRLLTAAHTGIMNSAGEPVFRIVSNFTSDNDDETAAAEIPLSVLRRAYEYPLAQVYPQTSTGMTAAEPGDSADLPPFVCEASLPDAESSIKAKAPKKRRVSKAVPLAVIPFFPGTNCEWDMERAFRDAGARTKQVIFRNRSQNDINESLEELANAINEAQIVALSGGFSAGDEPDGSGKFIANVLRSPEISRALTDFLDKRDGLVIGICNGFQALIKTGLLPYGKFQNSKPTLTYNKVGRHISRMVRTRVMSGLSPWLALDEPGTIHTIPISHGEGRVVVERAEAEQLFKAGQVSFCYADMDGRPAMSEPDNPNGSDYGIEGICSPDGRILGKMGHSERTGEFVHINIPGNKKQRIFEAGVRYFG
ncbi:MAG: phosphoribosylformylglycinamidine synthase subunit PurQ, partial [Treponema sp.]|nr:phosphoribosylformylglycinamidine synthase subunit PurQ [Treponema sp.]